ncbi:MAG: hypothetical protein RMI43_06440 [Candidatus Caldarchaeum sp.]|nr:hypothetical protein [Candidatus Caldarchaeum sp.]
MEPRVISGCGILGVLRKQDAAKIAASDAVSSIECIRYRGSRLGAGFAAYNLDGPQNHLHKVKVFVSSEEVLRHVKNVLKEFSDGGLWDAGFDAFSGKFMSWTALVDASEDSLRAAVDRLNYELMNAGLKGRVYSWGRYVEVFKGVGYPLDVSRLYGLVERSVEADLWIAHTRQPTNSPGIYPIWSHPFSSHEWAIAHNGDISSFGSNMEFTRFRGFRSFVGTDSELIAYLLDYLTNIKHMPLEKAAKALVNPFEEDIINNAADISVDEYVAGRGAWLDGPFSVVAGFCDGKDVYMLALADRSKFRPLVVGEDEERFYVASEEAEIRQMSENARVWTVKPGGVFLASMKKGIIVSGREHPEVFYRNVGKTTAVGEVVDAQGLGYSQLNLRIRSLFEKGLKEVVVVNVNGHRYLGFNMPPGTRLKIHGTAGNCLANFNKFGEIIVYGSAQDDVGDAMYGGRVIIHGDARDVVGQALQGGEIFVRGSVGNRAAIQMREFKDSRPYLVVGGRADDYLGEYMAGGVVMVLGVDSIGLDEPLVGRYMATGMVGGRIYVRGRVERWRIGLHPPKPDVIRYLRGLYLDGLIDEAVLNSFEGLRTVTIDDVRKILSGEPLRRITKLFTSKYHKELSITVKRLDEELPVVEQPLTRFFHEFNLEKTLYTKLLKEEFTVVSAQPLQPAEQQREHQPEEG